MTIKSNGDGRTATRTSTGVTGGRGDGVPSDTRRSAPMAQATPQVAKRLPTQLKPVARRGK